MKEAADGDVDPVVRFAGLRRLAAGAISGAIAKTAVAPFDRTKILMQVSQMYGTQQYSGGIISTMTTIQRTEGIRGFFRGNSATGM
jgi:Mitochondrial carrier protein